MNKYNPVIVVVAYNRPRSLERLLLSLKAAKKIDHAKLIISIDNQEPHNFNVKKIAEDFIWTFGEKEVIYQKEKLGLRKHILQCGDLTEQYGAVIILEDDLYVSPYFYDYTVKALEYYSGDEQIGGISLYNQPREEVSSRLFSPLNDEADIYFVQFPSSWGQAWNKNQWQRFKKWYLTNPDLSPINIPDKVRSWPESSWKKYFCAYLVEMNKFVPYPRISLTTNFNDPGTHLKQLVNHDGQVQLQLFDMVYQFKHQKESRCIYDTYFELLPECVNSFTDQFKQYSFELDLYGHKDISRLKSSYVITSRPVKSHIAGFQRALKPHELNVILNLTGMDLFLSKKEDVLSFTNLKEKKIADYKYFYQRNLLGWKVLLKDYLQRLQRK